MPDYLVDLAIAIPPVALAIVHALSRRRQRCDDAARSTAGHRVLIVELSDRDRRR